MARDGPLPSVARDLGVGKTDSVARAHALGHLVNLAAAQLIRRRQHDSIDTLAAREHFGENLELRAGKRGAQILELHREAHVRLVDAETFHRLGVRQAQKWQLQLDPEHAAVNLRHHALASRHHVVDTRAGHLDIDLAELGLPVGAQVFVAKASRDLIVAVEAAHHQELFQKLRRLGQRVEASRVDAARHQVVARAFGRCAPQDRRFDFDKAVRVEKRARRPHRQRAPAQIALHGRAAQINIAIAQAHVLGSGVGVDRKRRGLRDVEDVRLCHRDFHFTGRKLRVDRALGAHHHLAACGQIILGAGAPRDLVRRGGLGGVENQLEDALAVAQIDEDESAVVAAGSNPSPQRNFAPGVGGAQCAAIVRARPGRQR